VDLLAKHGSHAGVGGGAFYPITGLEKRTPRRFSPHPESDPAKTLLLKVHGWSSTPRSRKPGAFPPRTRYVATNGDRASCLVAASPTGAEQARTWAHWRTALSPPSIAENGSSMALKRKGGQPKWGRPFQGKKMAGHLLRHPSSTSAIPLPGGRRALPKDSTDSLNPPAAAGSPAGGGCWPTKRSNPQGRMFHGFHPLKGVGLATGSITALSKGDALVYTSPQRRTPSSKTRSALHSASRSQIVDRGGGCGPSPGPCP